MPNPFQPGSSYSHLNEATYPKGNPNSQMTPAISVGETIRSPGLITLTMFKTWAGTEGPTRRGIWRL